jgi:hypothetical protein
MFFVNIIFHSLWEASGEIHGKVGRPELGSDSRTALRRIRPTNLSTAVFDLGFGFCSTFWMLGRSGISEANVTLLFLVECYWPEGRGFETRSWN